MSRTMRPIERMAIAPPAEPADAPANLGPGVETYPDAEFVGGRHTYGEALGIIMVHKYKARIPGDVGNAETFEFPVRYEVVAEASGTRHRRADPTLLEPFVRAALRLQDAGVRAITTSCGFLAFYQDSIAKRVEIPVFTSSLLLIPMVHRMAGRRGHVALSTSFLAMNTRLTRSSMIEVFSQDYITTARAKGLGRLRVLVHHALRNALLPVVTIMGFNLGFLFGGSVLVETVFAWPGIGRLMFDSLATRDYPVILGIFLAVAMTVVIANLLTDVAYAWLDPRVRY